MNPVEEARLLYSLLSAAEEEDRMRNIALAERWRSLREQVDTTECERVHAELVALFEELERTDTLAGTWIQFRWSQAKSKNVHPRPRAKPPRRK